ncbi:MAG TPA: hypothetical protein VNC40_16105 [Gaiellaceae bacterium]|nr:hypothetical protein [Gaiellaceae bacterium]
MRSRLIKLGAALTALTALAIGGSSLASAAHQGAPPAPPAAEVQGGAADTDNIQQGDQTASDAAGAQSEQAASESGPSDGPGGYADTNANADTQQQGEH